MDKFEKEFYITDNESMDKFLDGFDDLLDKAVKSNGGVFYLRDCIKVKIIAEYCPEDK